MNDLIKIEYLLEKEIEDIISSAKEFKNGKTADFSNRHLALMFFENSTRTRFSFECAVNKLKAHSYIFDNSKSSTSKGEDMFDTINNLCAIGIDTFVIRTREENFIDNLKKYNYFKPVHFVNAGEGKIAHPTQALLDYFTMKEKLGSMKNKKVAIIGDLKHSRVAKSNFLLLERVGAKVVFCAPEYFKIDYATSSFTNDLNEALFGADVVMCLRIQNERLEEKISREDFIKNYQINSNNLPKNAILMHPGPVNRGVEISEELLNKKEGQTILQQAQNGVFVRMAVLDKIWREND